MAQVSAAEAEPQSLSLADAIRAAQHLQRHAQWDEAQAIYQRILEAIPDEPNALHYLGILRHQQGNDVAAIELIRRAITQIPEDAGPWLNLGNVLLTAERFDEAIDAYRHAADLAPSNVLIYNNLGLLQSRRHNPELAEAAYLQALRLAPGADYVLNNFGRMLHNQGRYEEATAYGLKAVAISPNDPKARRLLSISYSLLGDFESARQVLRDWLAAEPLSAEAAHLLAGAGGLPTPARASDAYVAEEFNTFATSFDAKLEILGYKAPELVANALTAALGPGQVADSVLDAGCGTGLCSVLLRPMARRLDGVDLSSGMLEKAQQRGGYDQLTCAELAAFMTAHPARWNAIVSADTLCYFGDLAPAMVAAYSALLPQGLLVFSVEAIEWSEELSEAGYSLQYNGRYVHTRRYVSDCVLAAGMQLLALEAQTLRIEVMRPVRGWIVVACRNSAQPGPLPV